MASTYGIITFVEGRQNKGWKGQILERLAGLQGNTGRDPNGGTFELKSVSFYYSKGVLVPKETMAITMINQLDLESQEFFESHCWKKLKSLVLCAVQWHGKHNPRAELLDVVSFEFNETDQLSLEIKADYDLIRKKLITSGFNSLTGRDGRLIQARTKGPGHGSKSRAFYARKELIKLIFERGSR